MLTITAVISHGRPLWASPPDRRDEAEVARRNLAGVGAAAKSDHLAAVAAFNGWAAAYAAGGRGEAAAVRAGLMGKSECNRQTRTGQILESMAACNVFAERYMDSGCRVDGSAAKCGEVSQAHT